MHAGAAQRLLADASGRQPCARRGYGRADARVRRARLTRVSRSCPHRGEGDAIAVYAVDRSPRVATRERVAAHAASPSRSKAPAAGSAAEQPHHRGITPDAVGGAFAESVDNRLGGIVIAVEGRQTSAAGAAETWDALGTTVVLRLDTSDHGRRAAGRRAVERELDAIDGAASRFRSDSELSRVNRAGGAWVQIGPLLRDAIALAIRAAHVTDGAVDPTLDAT